jgi:hypothetical protein
MRLELRKSGGPTCETCGSYEHIAVAGDRVVHDLVEREYTRRELLVAREFRAHLAAVELDQRADLVAQLEWTLVPPLPPWWRLVKRVRRRLWRSTVEDAFETLDDFITP